MPIVYSHPHGEPCWFELGTTDQQAANSFYTQLLGWTVNEFPISDGEKYSMFQFQGRDVAAGYKMMPEMIAQGIRPHWMVYFASDNVDETVEKVQQLGGSVRVPPFDVMEHGRMAVCADPEGATFSLWQAKTHKGVGIFGEDGAVCWSELATRDLDRADKFYASLLGWDTRRSANPAMQYVEFMVSGAKQVGGMLQMDQQWEGIPTHWGIYFQVPDCDATAEKAKQLGGSVRYGPFEVPNVGRIAVVADPQGAIFHLIKLAQGNA